MAKLTKRERIAIALRCLEEASKAVAFADGGPAVVQVEEAIVITDGPIELTLRADDVNGHPWLLYFGDATAPFEAGPITMMVREVFRRCLESRLSHAELMQRMHALSIHD